MDRTQITGLQPLEDILAPDAIDEVRSRTTPCTREGCVGNQVPIGYVGDGGYTMTAYECEVCGDVEVRR
jgi:hypothetical protein